MSENTDSIKVFDCTIDEERFIIAAWNEKNVLGLLLKDDFIEDSDDVEFMKEIPVQYWYDTFIRINEDDEISLALIMKNEKEPFIIATTIID